MDLNEHRYQILYAIHESEQRAPNEFVKDIAIAEVTQLDLQTVRDELDLLKREGYTTPADTFGGRQAMLRAEGRRLLQQLAEQRARPPRARDVQQRILQFLTDHPPTARGAQWTTDQDITKALNLDLQYVRDNLELLAEQQLVKLRQPVDFGGGFFAESTARGRIMARERDLSLPPVGHSTQVSTDGGDYAGGNLDKRQGTFYTTSGDIHLGSVQNRQEPDGVKLAMVRFDARSGIGTSIYIKLLNFTDRVEEVWVFVYLQSGEQLLPRHTSGLPSIPVDIGARNRVELRVPLLLYREHPHSRPTVDRIEVQDALEQKTIITGPMIEELNAQITDQWEYSEDKEE